MTNNQDRHKTCGIYLIRCLINDKVYVGQSKGRISDRFYKHRQELRNNRHKNKYLQYDWDKFGEENFEFITVKDGLALEILDEEESDYIKFYQSNDPEFGYNIHNPLTRYPYPERQESRGPFLPSEKRGYIVTHPDGQEELVFNLNGFCKKFNLDNRTMFEVLRGLQKSHRDYKVRRTSETYLRNKFKDSYDYKIKDYVLFDPEGNKHEVSNLRAWLEERSLLGLYTGLVQCATQEGQYSFHDWQCYYKENAPEQYTPAHLLKGYNQYFVVDPEGNYYNFTLKELKDFLENKEEKSENLVRLARKKLTKKSFKGYRCSLLENKEEILKAIKLEELEKTLTSLEKKVDNILDSYFHTPEKAENRDYCVYAGLRDWNPTIVKPKELKAFCEKEGINYYRAMDCAAGRQKSTKNNKEEVLYIKRITK